MNMRFEMFSLYFKRHSLFAGLNEQQVEEIHSASRQNLLKKGRGLVINGFQPNRIYLLANGKMKIADSIMRTDQVVQDILYPGELFGNISLNGFRGEEYAEALMNDTLVYCFGIHEFKSLLKSHHRLAINYADNISKRLLLLKERYEIWTRHDTKTKFIYLLNKWAQCEGRELCGRVILNNYLSLTDIAGILSVSRQFMHVLIKEMTAAGQIRYSRRQIEINSTALKDLLPD